MKLDSILRKKEKLLYEEKNNIDRVRKLNVLEDDNYKRWIDVKIRNCAPPPSPEQPTAWCWRYLSTSMKYTLLSRNG